MMTFKEIIESVYKDVGQLAINLYRSNKTFSEDEIIKWINVHHPELPNPYKGLQGVLQAAFDRTDNDEIRNAIRIVFVNRDGNSLWPL